MKMNTTSVAESKRGFTLIEVMIVVFIIALLATIAIPAFASARKSSQVSSFSKTVKTFADAAEFYIMENGEWPPDGSSGSLPAPLRPYMSQRLFESETPVGGEWDFERHDSGITSGVGVVDPTVDPSVFLEIDATIDDGDLSTGVFQELGGGRYYYIISD